MIDYSVLTKVGLVSVYLAEILRLGSRIFLGYLIDSVLHRAVALSPLPASSNNIPNLCNSGWLGGENMRSKSTSLWPYFASTLFSLVLIPLHTGSAPNFSTFVHTISQFT